MTKGVLTCLKSVALQRSCRGLNSVKFPQIHCNYIKPRSPPQQLWRQNREKVYITWSLFKVRENVRVHLSIGFQGEFASDWLKNWRDQEF